MHLAIRSPGFETTVSLYALVIAGLILAMSFLAMHRPKMWLRTEALNSAGWVIIVALWYIRSLVLLTFTGTSYRFESWGKALWSLGLLFALDALLLLRVVSWGRYVARRRAEKAMQTPKPEDLDLGA